MFTPTLRLLSAQKAFEFQRDVRLNCMDPNTISEPLHAVATELKEKLGYDIDPDSHALRAITIFASRKSQAPKPLIPLLSLLDPDDRHHEAAFQRHRDGNPSLDLLGYWSMYIWQANNVLPAEPRYYSLCYRIGRMGRTKQQQNDATNSFMPMTYLTPWITYACLGDRRQATIFHKGKMELREVGHSRLVDTDF